MRASSSQRGVARTHMLRRPDSLNGALVPKEEVKTARRQDGSVIPQIPTIHRSPNRRMESLTHSMHPTENVPNDPLRPDPGHLIRKIVPNKKHGLTQDLTPTPNAAGDNNGSHRRFFSRSVSHEIPKGDYTSRGKGCLNGTKNGDQIASERVTTCLWHDRKQSDVAPDLTDAITLLARRRPAPASALRTSFGKNATPEPTPRPHMRCISPNQRLMTPTSPSRIKTDGVYSSLYTPTSFIEHMNTIPKNRASMRCRSSSNAPAVANPNVLANDEIQAPRRGSVTARENYSNPILGMTDAVSEATTPRQPVSGRRTFANCGQRSPARTISPTARFAHRRDMSTAAPFAYDTEQVTKQVIHTGRRPSQTANRSVSPYDLGPSLDSDLRTGKRLVRVNISPMRLDQNPKSHVIPKLRPKNAAQKKDGFSFDDFGPSSSSGVTPRPNITPRPTSGKAKVGTQPMNSSRSQAAEA